MSVFAALLVSLSAGPVEAVILTDENWAEYAPRGKEVDAIVGDLVLRNESFVAVIAAPRADRHANLTCRNVGGCLIDFTTRDEPNDQLTVYRPGGKDVRYRQWEIATGDTEDDPQSFEAIDKGRIYSAAVVTLAVESLDKPPMRTEYRFAGGESRFDNSAELSVTTDNPPAPPTDILRMDAKNEWVFGGKDSSLGVFSTVADVYRRELIHMSTWHAGGAGNRDAGGAVSNEMSDRGMRVRFSAVTPDERFSVPDAGVDRLSRTLVVGRNMGDATRRSYVTSSDEPVGPFGEPAGRFSGSLTVQFIGPDGPVAGVLVKEADAPASAAVMTGADGIYQSSRTPSSHTATFAGFPIVAEPRSFGDTPVDKVWFRDRSSLRGFLAFDVAATSGGRPTPCKLEFLDAGAGVPDWGPPSAERGVRNLRYLADGVDRLLLPAKPFRVRATHGPEFDAVVRDLPLDDPEAFVRRVELDLPRAFETPGWISADFHSHASPSGDNTASQRGRVLNLVCEDIDFAPCTEHQRVDSYQTHIDALGIGGELLSCPGMELTGSPLPLNHHNVFPMRHTPHAQDGGGPVVAGDPDAQIERLLLWDERAEKLIQQNHPDIGWLFRDRDGDGQPDDGFARGVGLLDCVEIHPIEAALRLLPDPPQPSAELKQEWAAARLVEWFQLLNQGRRLPGVVNTDAHWNFHGSGWLRNWIRVPDDDPATCEVMDIVRATKAGRVVMSNGPFLTLSLSNEAGETAGVGDDLTSEGVVTATVRVQCANWVDVDRVGLLVDGRSVRVFRRDGEGAEFFAEGPLRFKAEVSLPIAADAHVIAVCGHGTKTLGEVYGPDHEDRNFAAMTNPIWVDLAGDGYTPSGDTLDRPLAGKRAD